MTISAKERSFARPTLSTSPADAPTGMTATRERASTSVVPVNLPHHRRTSSMSSSSSAASTPPSSLPSLVVGAGSGKTVDISLAYVMLMQEKERRDKETAVANGTEKSIDAGDADEAQQQQQQQNLQMAEKIRESLAEEEALVDTNDDDEDDGEEESSVSSSDIAKPDVSASLEEENETVLLEGDNGDGGKEHAGDKSLQAQDNGEEEPVPESDKAKAKSEGEAASGDLTEEKMTPRKGAANSQPIEFPQLCSSPSLASEPVSSSLHLIVAGRSSAAAISKTASSPAIPHYTGAGAAQFISEAASMSDVTRLADDPKSENESGLVVVRPRSQSGSPSPTPTAMKYASSALFASTQRPLSRAEHSPRCVFVRVRCQQAIGDGGAAAHAAARARRQREGARRQGFIARQPR
jgi:hypothetical protein